MKAKKFLGIGAILSLMICVAVSSSVPHKKFLMTGGATALAGVVLCAYEMNKAFQAAKKTETVAVVEGQKNYPFIFYQKEHAWIGIDSCRYRNVLLCI